MQTNPTASGPGDISIGDGSDISIGDLRFSVAEDILC